MYSNRGEAPSQILTLFISSLYFFGFFTSLLAFHATTRFDRLIFVRIGGAFVFVGAAIGGQWGPVPSAPNLGFARLGKAKRNEDY
ncbi:hypothetical protein IEQ34_020358 [Dendrobium chrysotoxum]|uniref:Uncharacterized protein n=1 Tax=Dendrobium chrysotoxum TaxID=161865 RepID=A0AAV7G087_DENCH|nr:hypothetical protein IEQ34_020358 [Dendrobium chrysotoxum]